MHLRQQIQSIFQPQPLYLREDRNAYFVRVDGCHKKLKIIMPVDLNTVRYLIHLKMPARGISSCARLFASGIETSPIPDTRVETVGTDDPTGTNRHIVEQNGVRSDSGHTRFKTAVNANVKRAIKQQAMQSGSADASAWSR